MIKLRQLMLLLCLVFVLSGCSQHNMALTKGQLKVDPSEKSIALLYVKISNQFKPKYQLEIFGAQICPQGETCRQMSTFHRATKEPYKSEEGLFNEYLMSFELEPATYNFHALSCHYSALPIYEVFAGIFIDFEKEIKQNSVIYLGHMEIILRERKNDDEKNAAAPQSSLGDTLGNKVVGLSGGTLDVLVKDGFDEDIKLFTAEYPGLEKIKVEKSILQQKTKLKK